MRRNGSPHHCGRWCGSRKDARPLIRELDARFANELGIFFRVRRNIPAGAQLRLISGRGTLATKNPVMTVESYWPYATTLFDYIRRAMPFASPGSLTADEIYAASAYILAEAKIIDKSMVLDAQTLPRVEMP